MLTIGRYQRLHSIDSGFRPKRFGRIRDETLAIHFDSMTFYEYLAVTWRNIAIALIMASGPPKHLNPYRKDAGRHWKSGRRTVQRLSLLT